MLYLPCDQAGDGESETLFANGGKWIEAQRTAQQPSAHLSDLGKVPNVSRVAVTNPEATCF